MTDAEWNGVKALAKRNSGSIWLRTPNNNDQAQGVICGAPYGREVHWDPTTQDYASCTGTGCGHCKATLKKTTRVLMNIWPPEEQRMMVIEVTGKTFEDICVVRDSVGDLEKKVLVRDGEDEDHPTPTGSPTSTARDSNAAIAPPVVGEFRKRLRDLPRDKAYEPILRFLGAKRLDEIRAADEHRARGLIERAERGEDIPPPPPPSNELDEFA